jgi:hypothetical protein
VPFHYFLSVHHHRDHGVLQYLTGNAAKKQLAEP